MDLSNLSAVELKNLLEQASRELKRREKSGIDAARNEIYAIAHRMGLPLKDLIGDGTVRKLTGKVAVQYRNPMNSDQAWTGRGRHPGWVKELIEAGKDLESARV